MTLGLARGTCLAVWLIAGSVPAGLAVAAETAATLTDRGLELAQSGRAAAAAELWKKALEITPEYYPALFNLGYMHYSAGSFKHAKLFLEKAAEVSPQDFNAHYLHGAVAQKLGMTDTALRSWRRALALRPDHVELMQIMAVEYGKGRYFREAADIAMRALQLKPALEDLHYMAIHACRQAGDLRSGLTLSERAAERYPLAARANFEFGWHLQRDGRFEDALPLLRKAIELDPNYEEPHFFYGDWLVKQARYEEALEPLRRAIAVRTDYMPAHISLARALMGLKDWDRALAALQAAERIEPRHPQPHLLLSQVYFRLRNRARAREEKEISLRLRRQNPAFLESAQSRPFRD